ncbi:fimbrillin family protein [Bacteroides fragilis]
MKKKKEWKDASLHVCRGMMLCAAVSLLAGCTGEGDETMPEKDGRVALKVSSGIEVQTRAHDEQWDAGDAIGIYMLDGETAEDANKKYTTESTGTSGSFSAAGGQTIYFPVDGSQRDFIAYYPYRTQLTDNLYAVDVSNQAVQKDIDLMGAEKVTGKTKNDPAVAFEFQHKLVKLYLTIKPDDVSLFADDMEGLEIDITNQKTKATYDVVAGGPVSVNTEDNTPTSVRLLTDADGTSSEGIVLPNATTEGMQFVFRLKNGPAFTWDIRKAQLSQSFKAGSKYVYTISIGLTGIEVTSSIEDWTPGNGDGGETGSAE